MECLYYCTDVHAWNMVSGEGGGSGYSNWHPSFLEAHWCHFPNCCPKIPVETCRVPSGCYSSGSRVINGDRVLIIKIWTTVSKKIMTETPRKPCYSRVISGDRAGRGSTRGSMKVNIAIVCPHPPWYACTLGLHHWDFDSKLFPQALLVPEGHMFDPPSPPPNLEGLFSLYIIIEG